MKNLFLLLVALIQTLSLFSQAPEAFNYQGIARDISGTPLSNRQITLRLAILQGNQPGFIVYQESHNLTTNKLGVFSVEVGRGNAEIGQITDINWGISAHYIRTEMDADGGTDFTLLGESQLLSVPYALYADQVGSTESYWKSNSSGIDYSNGNVGIGTDNPEQKLSIEGNDPIGENRSYVSLQNNSLSNRSATFLELSAGVPNSKTSLQHISETYDFDGDTYTDFGLVSSNGRGLIMRSESAEGVLKFMTQGSEATPVERMRIAQDGNVGIGSANPKSKLSILGNDPMGDARNYLDISNLSLSNRSVAWMQVSAGVPNTFTALQHCSETYDFDENKYNDFGQVVSTGNGLIVRASGEDGIIKFLLGVDEINSSTERMRLTTDGNLGIGTESPASRLQVTDGDVYIEDINKGVIMKSPDGNCWRMTINNDGSMKTTPITCPN